MRVLLTVAVLALVGAGNAEAHLVSKRPKDATLRQTFDSQTKNMKHARYVCNRGKGENRNWHCNTYLWLKRERLETLRALEPPQGKIYYLSAWLCIHRYEKDPRQGWATNTGNGYYGGLQMDWDFMKAYGPELLRAKGPANNWTAYEQMLVAEKAHKTRGFYPWPRTARKCGLI